MSRRLIVALLALAAPAAADELPPETAPEPAPETAPETAEPAPPASTPGAPDVAAPPGDAPSMAAPASVAPSLDAAGDAVAAEPPDPSDQSIGAAVGIAAGGRVTPGGLRITGHYLYQLSADDWFDGTASFTFGGGGAACFRDRMDATVCDHGLADGASVEITAAVRRIFAARGPFRPFARAGVGVAVARFGDDDVTGVAIPLHAGAGLRASVGEGVAIVALADLVVGIGRFGRDLGAEPLFGFAITAGAELRLP